MGNTLNLRNPEFSVVLAFFLLIPASLAQVGTGTITGVVRDEQGAVIPGATVIVRNVGTNQAVEVLTNDRGVYRVTPLLIGQYEVTASLTGFKTERRTGITINVQQVARIDFTLQIGAITDEVVVSGEAPQLETETSSLGLVVEQKAVTDLPLNGRNYLQLAKLSAGVLDPPRAIGLPQVAPSRPMGCERH